MTKAPRMQEELDRAVRCEAGRRFGYCRVHFFKIADAGMEGYK